MGRATGGGPVAGSVRSGPPAYRRFKTPWLRRLPGRRLVGPAVSLRLLGAEGLRQWPVGLLAIGMLALVSCTRAAAQERASRLVDCVSLLPESEITRACGAAPGAYHE